MYKVESYVYGVKDTEQSFSSWSELICVLPPLVSNQQVVISCI